MPIRLQSDAEGISKQSTVYYGLDHGGLWPGLAQDLSQRFAPLTVSGSTAYEDYPASERFDFSHPRTIGIVCSVEASTEGEIFNHSSGGTELTLEIVAGPILRATQNGVVVGSLPIPAGDDPAGFLLAWISRANPLATGAGDAVQSWLICYAADSESLTKVAFTHAAKVGANNRATWGGLAPSTVEGIWYASSAQSPTEILRDWALYFPTPPSSSCDLDLPPLPLERFDEALGENAIYGPVPQWAAVHVRHALRRHWTPLANIVYQHQPILRSAPEGASAYRLAPGSTGYRMGLHWMQPAEVPPGCTHAWVRLQVRTWVVSGLAVPFGVRVYSLSRRPDDAEGGPLVVRQVGEVVTRSDTSTGAGQWDIEQLLELAVGEDGWTYLCPAFQWDPAGVSANVTNARAQIRALHAVPCVAE